MKLVFQGLVLILSHLLQGSLCTQVKMITEYGHFYLMIIHISHG